MIKLLRRVLVAGLVGLPLAGNAAPPPPSLHAATVLAEIKHRGARAVAATLWSSDNARWDKVIGNIDHGSREWLQVAAALRPGTDAGASEALDEAVFLALKAAPASVLRLLKAGTFETDTVCSSNIAIDHTAAQSRQFISDRIKTLENFSEPSTLAARDQCLSRLRAALADLDK
jgi:hypothetical protein